MKADDPRPPSVQIADDLREQIRDGRLAEGARLPSGRALAQQYGVALMTAQSAVQRLRDEGLVFSGTRGYFVGKPDSPAAIKSDPAYMRLAEELEATKARLRQLEERVAALEARDHT